jgi:DNA/RNA endonuclease YhcR with UshA esterase domain
MKIRTVIPVCIGVALLYAIASAEGTNTTIKSGTSTNVTAKSTEPIKVTAPEAKDHIGANALVTGTIADVYKKSGPYRLNFEQPYPNQVFTAVIFARNTNDFPEIDKLKGKKVQVSGKIADYRGHPEIVLNSTNQLKLLEKPAEKK